MKLSSFVLAVSIVANFAFAVVVLVGLQRAPESAAATSGSASPPASASVASARAATGPAGAADPETWNNLQGVDVSASIERLRAAGFPPALVRALGAEL